MDINFTKLFGISLNKFIFVHAFKNYTIPGTAARRKYGPTVP